MHLSLFNQHRHRLFDIAYRMLGSVSDSEDVIQEAWLKWHKLILADIDNPAAYLTTMVTRLAIDALRERQAQTKSYKGPWLPEPLLTEPGPGALLERLDDLSFAFMMLLEQLSAQERAVFVLKEAFGLSHTDIGQALAIDVANSRQLLSRAKKRLQGISTESAGQDNHSRQQAALMQLMEALISGDIDKTRALLTTDSIAYTDGGGVVSAAIIPLEGAERIFQVFTHIIKTNTDPTRVQWIEVNGDNGLAIFRNEELVSVFVVELKGDLIHRVFVQRNPHKLEHLKHKLAMP